MTVHRWPTVACCIRDTNALERVSLALEAEGAAVAVVERQDVIGQTAGVTGSAALVYDLEPRDGSESRVIAAFRDCVPTGPILLYPRASHDVARHLEIQLVLPAVCLRLQHENFHDMESLRHDVRRMLNLIPCRRLALLVRGALPALPEPIGAFVEQSLYSLSCEPHGSRPLVEEMASKAGTRVRTLERLSSESGLPKPKELLDWMILLYLAFLVESERMTWRAAMGRVGLGKKTLYRMRHRLLPTTGNGGRGGGGAGDNNLDAVVLAFAQRCGACGESSEHAAWQVAG